MLSSTFPLYSAVKVSKKGKALRKSISPKKDREMLMNKYTMRRFKEI